MSTIRSRSRFFNYMNVPLRLVLVLFFVLSALNLPVIEPVKAAKGPLCGSDPTLVGCWPMEEGSGTTLIDDTTNHNDAATTASPTWVTGRIGLALDLNGTGQYAIAPDSNSLDLTNAMTLAAWIRPGKLGTQNILKKTTGTTIKNGYELSLSSSGKVFVRFNGDALYRVDSTTSYPTNGTTWMHVAATYDGTSTNIRLYINGVLEGTKPGVAIVANSTPLGIGAEPATTRINFYQGAIDDARVYNRALSSAEIQELAGVSSSATFTVTKTGTGTGTVTSSPTGINCGADCSEAYSLNTVVTLTAVPDGTSTFTGWSGSGCSGTGTCVVTMDASKVVSADFTLISSPTGITCTTLNPKPLTAGTGEKPQSKVWNYLGSWFAVFPTSASGASSAGTWLWRLQDTTWMEVLKLSDSTSVKADVKPVGNVVHVLLYQGASTQLVSVEYTGGTYQPWSLRNTPAAISLSGSEIATIDIDSNGRMWLATENDATDQIVAHYSDTPYSTWNGPITIASGVNGDDISAVIAMPGRIGIFWSNQVTRRFGFRTHVDGTDPSTWTADEVPASQSALNVGLGMADDHLNLKVAPDGTLYAAVKTSYDTAGYPKIALLVRRPVGTWDNLYALDETGTRGIIELDKGNTTLTYIYTQAEGYNNIVYRQSNTASIAFGSLQTLRTGGFNDASSLKGNYSSELVVLYGSGSEVAGQICAPTPATWACENDPTLVGCWQMEENRGVALVDGSSFMNDAALSGGPAWGTGKVGSYALDLNGTSQYGLVADNPTLNLTNMLTVAAWIRPEQYATQDLIKKATNGSVNGFELSLANTKPGDVTSQRPFFRINQFDHADTYRVSALTEYPIDGTWMHVAATYDGNIIRLYINGVPEASLLTSESIVTNTLPLMIGAQDGTTASRWFKGWMDGVRVYNRALSLDEIQILAGISPTAVTLASFSQGPLTNGVQLDWSTATEVGLLGFNLYRSDELAGVKQKLNVDLIPALTPGDLMGNAYQFTDATAVSGNTYTYWIELVIFHGNQESDPVTVLVPYWIRLPMISR